MEANNNQKNNNVPNKTGNLPKEMKQIIQYYKWEKALDEFSREKKSSEKEETLYVLNKKFIEDWKSKIFFEELKKELDKAEKEHKDLEKEFNDFYKIKNINLNEISFGKIENEALINDKNKAREKMYINPNLKEEEIVKVTEDVFKCFKDFGMDVEIKVESKLKNGKYILSSLKDEKDTKKSESKNSEEKKEEKEENKNLEKINEKKEIKEKENKGDILEQGTEKNEKKEGEVKAEEKMNNKEQEQKKDKKGEKEIVDNIQNGILDNNKEKVIEKKEEIVKKEKEIDNIEEDKKNSLLAKKRNKNEENNQIDQNDKKSNNIIIEQKKENLENQNAIDNRNVINNNNIIIENNNNPINQNNTNSNNNSNNNNNNNMNNNNMNNFNNINNEFMLQFQNMVEKYLKEHGAENSFINKYFCYCKLEPKNEEEKAIINYYRTKADNYQPNIFNGLVILNTELPSLGLTNVGATCYMNATLQCIIHIKELSELFLSAFFLKYPKEDENFQKQHLLSSEYVNILSNVFFPKLYSNENKSFAPYKFKEIIGKLNPLFSGIMANDAKDLLQFIFERMHSELKMAICFYMEYPCDQRVEQSALEYFFNSYVFQNQSPLLSYVYGITKIQTKCSNCQTIKYNFQSYNLLYFPLKESKRHVIELKKNQNKNFDEKNYILTLEDCFIFNEKIEHFTGDNSMFCNVCNDCYDADYQTMLYNAPTVLSIVLNRGKGNSDFTEKFIFGKELNIENFLHNNEKKGKYYLIGIVVHYGGNDMSGHFMAFCRMDKNSKWFRYNDAFVSACENLDEEIKKGVPYILFYHQE